MRSLKITGLAMILGLSFGCTTYSSAHFPISTDAQATASGATSPEAVEIIETGSDRRFIVIGKVHSHGRCNWLFGFAGCGDEQLLETLQEEAGALGADAIINVQRNSFAAFEWSDRHVHGTAIRWND